MKHRPYLVAALFAGGCSLINAQTLSADYAFAPQQFSHDLGDGKTMAVVPSVACDPGSSTDACAQAQAGLPATSATLVCEASSRTCVANVELRLPYPVDLSMQSLPSSVVQFGVDNVTIKKIAYWIMTNTVNVALPPIDLYVASSAAKDETDPSAVLLGSVAGLPAHSATCVDAADKDGDPMSDGAPVCDVALSGAGEAALATFVKSYQTPFQLIAHTKFTAHAGEPLPTGTIDFFLRPTVNFSVLK